MGKIYIKSYLSFNFEETNIFNQLTKILNIYFYYKTLNLQFTLLLLSCFFPLLLLWMCQAIIIRCCYILGKDNEITICKPELLPEVE